MKIDLMQTEHLEQIIEIEYLALNHIGFKVGKRQRSNLEHALRINPAGCFVALIANKPIGFIFSRCWGTVGFLGMFAIHPDYMGKGYGKKLDRHFDFFNSKN